MNRKTVKVALLAVVLASLGVGYVVSQLLLERTVTGTVTIASQPDLYVLDSQNKPVTVLDFGTLSNGVHLTQNIRLVNVGNTPLTILVERTDASTGISSLVKRQDGSAYDNAAPATLAAGQSLTLTLEIFNSVSLSAGQYPLAFKITGS